MQCQLSYPAKGLASSCFQASIENGSVCTRSTHVALRQSQRRATTCMHSCSGKGCLQFGPPQRSRRAPAARDSKLHQPQAGTCAPHRGRLMESAGMPPDQAPAGRCMQGVPGFSKELLAPAAAICQLGSGQLSLLKLATLACLALENADQT